MTNEISTRYNNNHNEEPLSNILIKPCCQQKVKTKMWTTNCGASLNVRKEQVESAQSGHISLTTKFPRIRDSRFLHTGSRISRQLKLRTAAGALAQARADWRGVGGYLICFQCTILTYAFILGTEFSSSAFLTPRRWRV